MAVTQIEVFEAIIRYIIRTNSKIWGMSQKRVEVVFEVVIVGVRVEGTSKLLPATRTRARATQNPLVT